MAKMAHPRLLGRQVIERYAAFVAVRWLRKMDGSWKKYRYHYNMALNGPLLSLPSGAGLTQLVAGELVSVAGSKDVCSCVYVHRGGQGEFPLIVVDIHQNKWVNTWQLIDICYPQFPLSVVDIHQASEHQHLRQFIVICYPMILQGHVWYRTRFS